MECLQITLINPNNVPFLVSRLDEAVNHIGVYCILADIDGKLLPGGPQLFGTGGANLLRLPSGCVRDAENRQLPVFRAFELKTGNFM